MKNFIPFSLVFISIVQLCFAPPVTQNKEKPEEESQMGGLEDYMEYHRYLREVVNALESDPQFREKLEKAEEHDIRSGKIAEELEFVSHNIRNRLDEIKRVELKRLKELTEKKRRLQENIDLEDPSHKHLDHSNLHSFEIEDLKKLIAKTTADLVEADKKRREEFKQYELQKEFEKQLKLNHTNGDDRDKLEKEFKVQEREEKHKKHEKLHEPGHKAQLEEVWQEQDQMQQEFDPKTFFMLHDIDSNGLWDQDEVKALFIKELEKMYAAGEPEDDMRERAEEMERMRESVFKEVDVNRDGFIDYEEFLAQTKRNDFQQDHGWQGLDERKAYSDQELEEYVRQQQMMNQVPHGYPPQYPPAYQQVPPGYHPNVPVHPNGAPMHPGAVPPPQYHPGQVPQHPQQLHLNTNEVYPQHNQGYQGQVNYQHQPPPNYQQQQVPHPNYQQQQQPNYQQQQQPNYQQQQQPNYQQQQPNYQKQQPQAVNQQQQPQAVNQQQQPQAVNQQQQPQAVNQQQQPQAVNQQQQPQTINQQQVPAQQQVPVQPPVPNQPVQGNVQQAAPAQANNPNLNKLESPQVNQI